jgi:hypothetical protein
VHYTEQSNTRKTKALICESVAGLITTTKQVTAAIGTLQLALILPTRCSITLLIHACTIIYFLLLNKYVLYQHC